MFTNEIWDNKSLRKQFVLQFILNPVKVLFEYRINIFFDSAPPSLPPSTKQNKYTVTCLFATQSHCVYFKTSLQPFPQQTIFSQNTDICTYDFKDLSILSAQEFILGVCKGKGQKKCSHPLLSQLLLKMKVCVKAMMI